MTDGSKTGAEDSAMAGPLLVASAVSGGVRVLTVSGEIDHHTGGTLREALGASGTAHPRVVADLRRVSFMDSSGINILISAHRSLTEAGGWLRLAAPSAPVLRTVQIVGLDAVIDCHPTVDQALDR
ncbi:STAS domain-containing protein [Streptomyces sp. LP11]|uniref:Anti-sigma factor antagonist n=1 Tax=Streptomyces pyxinicus TaxID=2970331 RepID=A0ABT2B586_9ACTN|nr:STAS domain-containing protein [Streptomyces sp. LP11]MCS0603587.1 STAS domain-containing protein [Streptomyces sp. LP11]